MPKEVVQRAAGIEAEFGPDVEEAISRFEASGASLRDPESWRWMSVAFLFARKLRNIHEV
jgi:hypothetical protein